MDHHRLHARAEGRVQGVGFRFFVEARARELGLLGWVKNRPDGSVELVAEGPEDALRSLLEAVQAGPPSAQVTSVDPTWEPARGDLQPFGVRR